MSGSVLNWMKTNEGRHKAMRRAPSSENANPLIKLPSNNAPRKMEKVKKDGGTLDIFLQPAEKSLIIDEHFSMEDFQLATMRWKQQNLKAQ